MAIARLSFANSGKAGIYAKKGNAMCVWWDWKEIVHYDLLLHGQTINSNVYYQRLERLRQSIERKRLKLIDRKGFVFHHDNARPYTSLAIEYGYILIVPSRFFPSCLKITVHYGTGLHINCTIPLLLIAFQQKLSTAEQG